MDTGLLLGCPLLSTTAYMRREQRSPRSTCRVDYRFVIGPPPRLSACQQPPFVLQTVSPVGAWRRVQLRRTALAQRSRSGSEEMIRPEAKASLSSKFYPGCPQPTLYGYGACRKRQCFPITGYRKLASRSLDGLLLGAVDPNADACNDESQAQNAQDYCWYSKEHPEHRDSEVLFTWRTSLFDRRRPPQQSVQTCCYPNQQRARADK